MAIIIDMSIPELEAYIAAQQMIRLKTSPKNVPQLTDEVLEELVRVAHDYDKNYYPNSGFDLLKFTSVSSPCGCMGPSEGYKLCPCMQSFMLETYKLDVALAISTHRFSRPSS